MHMLNTMFDHLAWADANALDALRGMPSDTAEHARAVTIYAHLVGAEHVWLARLHGRTPDYAIWPSLDLDAAARAAAENASAYRAYVAIATPDDFKREIAYRTSSGQEFRNRIDDVLAHVALHGSYHRGQLALLARQGGGEPAVTDYIAFVRGVSAPTYLSPDPVLRS
jgi:uncharacterized damage-inducible protein DinB